MRGFRNASPIRVALSIEEEGQINSFCMMYSFRVPAFFRIAGAFRAMKKPGKKKGKVDRSSSRTEALSFRVTDGERKYFNEAAEARGESLSQFFRQASSELYEARRKKK